VAEVHLISVWPLKNGCPKALIETLKSMPDKIIANEPGTLSYAINLPSPDPLQSNSATETDETIDKIIFIETYQNAEAFKAHVNGSLFTEFRTQNLKYFQEDPDKPGWPVTQTSFYIPLASA